METTQFKLSPKEHQQFRDWVETQTHKKPQYNSYLHQFYIEHLHKQVVIKDLKPSSIFSF